MNETTTQSQHTKEVKLPISNQTVVIKTMITGAEREQIETAPTKYSRVGERGEVVITDIAKASLAEKHAMLDVYVVSVEGSPTNCRERLMKLYEDDYNAVVQAIEEVQKKTNTSMKNTLQ